MPNVDGAKNIFHRDAVAAWFIVMCLLFLGGCTSGLTTYANPQVDLGYVRKVAVLPFENHTEARFAGERVRDIVTTEILSRGLFDVVETGDLKRFLREEMVVREHHSLDLATSKKLLSRLEAQAYLAGSVDDFSEMRNGPYSYPVIAVTLRLVDSASGQIVWQVSGHESGYRTMDRLFGFASEDANEVTFRLVSRLMATLAKE